MVNVGSFVIWVRQEFILCLHTLFSQFSTDAPAFIRIVIRCSVSLHSKTFNIQPTVEFFLFFFRWSDFLFFFFCTFLRVLLFCVSYDFIAFHFICDCESVSCAIFVGKCRYAWFRSMFHCHLCDSFGKFFSTDDDDNNTLNELNDKNDFKNACAYSRQLNSK